MAINQEVLAQLNTTQTELLSLLAEDVREIFTTMVGMEIPLCDSLSLADARFKGCVSAMILLSGSYQGVVGFHATPRAAMDIAGQMLGMEVAEVDADVTDALGEIANMVGGSFKHHFVNDGHEVRLMPPTVIDRNEQFRPPESDDGLLALLFEAGLEHILVTVHLEAWN
ncbi:chemotaxis protein CheX [Geomonas silvestris]|uniref:Chemotaxis protein CheX n=1 Tax=Geomonas silvestris TaxID=2740184 RepID=A0A6V8MKA4_9BACT|nr:chemotaxis protein CheX [Geomonas silvestris]GFO60441.1 chemotaxis protein CheX [Geomonas silvestris]